MHINVNIDWKRTLLISADVVMAVYMVLVLVSWHKPKEHDVVCNKVVIRIEDEPVSYTHLTLPTICSV